MEQDWRSGALKTFVMVVLCQQVEYRAFRKHVGSGHYH